MCRPEKPVWRKAVATDVPDIAAMAVDFYRHEHLEFIPRRFTAALRGLLKSKSCGAAWLIESDGKAIGYVIVCCGYSIEYGGITALVDELYVHAAHRARGIGTATLEFLSCEAKARGWPAIQLEVVRANVRAAALYKRNGFEDIGRTLLTRRLDR